MAKTINTRTKYKLIGSDYSAQEPRMTAHLSGEPVMLEAYTTGKDLYAMIAQAAFDNNYGDNLEFWPEFTKVVIDGKEHIAGNGKEYAKELQAGITELILPTCYSIDTEDGEKSMAEVNAGDKIIASEAAADILQAEQAEKSIINECDVANIKLTIKSEKATTCVVRSPAKIKNPEGKNRRSVGKVLNLAATYGMSGSTAAQRLGKAREEGEQLLDNFFKGFPKVKEAIEQSKEFLEKNGYVEDFIGRRRRLPEINLPAYEVTLANQNSANNFNPFIGCDNRVTISPKISYWNKKIADAVKASQEFQIKKAIEANKEYVPNDEMSNKAFEKLEKEARQDGVILKANTGRRAQASRQCFNARIQGSAASLTKIAMIDITRDELMKQYGAKLVITVHDEVLVECPAVYADLVEKRLPEIMTAAAAKAGDKVPQACDPMQVTRWYADEIAAKVLDEYTKLQKTLGPDEALNHLCEEHPEFPREAILATVKTGCDLEF